VNGATPCIYPVMRAHLPCLLALVSATTYVACGSSDPSRAEQDGGAGGEAGDHPSSGGSQASGGSVNSGGTVNSSAGEGGALGGMPGSGGSGGADVSGGDTSMIGGAAGAGGAAGLPDLPDDQFPAICPGVIGDYTRVDGTTDDDAFTATQQIGKALIFGLAGNDTFDKDLDGTDCLIGGAGDDDFTAAGESTSYLVGGSGADTFHIGGFSFSSVIADMRPDEGDVIGLNLTNYALTGQAGDTPSATELVEVVDYEAGTGVVPAGTGGALVYDPATGSLWRDFNRGTKGDGSAQQVAKIVNYASYTFDLNDFVLD